MNFFRTARALIAAGVFFVSMGCVEAQDEPSLDADKTVPLFKANGNAVSVTEGASQGVIDKESVPGLERLLPHFLRDYVLSGKLPIYVHSNKKVVTLFATKEAATKEDSHKTIVGDLNEARLKDLISRPELPFTTTNQVGESGAEFLWNFYSYFWKYRYFSLDFALHDYSLFKYKNAGQMAASSAERTKVSDAVIKGKLTRINPLLKMESSSMTQIFREKVSFFLNNTEEAVSEFLTIRFWNEKSDGFWTYSPVTGGLKKLDAANRDDSVIASALALNDFLGFSENFNSLKAVRGKTQVLLVPSLVDNEVKASISEVCVSFNDDTPKTARSLPHLSGIAAKFYSQLEFTPKRLIRIDLLNQDPFSPVGREEVWVDPEKNVPVYRVLYDRQGKRKKWVVNLFAEYVNGENNKKLLVPRVSFIASETSGRFAYLHYTAGEFCSGAQANEPALLDFDPSRLGLVPT
jgi:hypothetical protein